MKRWHLISLVIILLSIIIINCRTHFIAFNLTKDSREPDFSLMTYNVAQGGYERTTEKCSRKDSLFKIIQEVKPDILCMQEYNKWNIRKFDSLMAKDYPFSAHKGHIYSKYKIISFGSLDMERRSSSLLEMKQQDSSLYKDASIGKVCLYADILVKGKRIRIYNIRLSSNNISKPLKDHDCSFLEKCKKLKDGYNYGSRLRNIETGYIQKEIKKCPYPFIVCGDFNSIYPSEDLQTIIGNTLKDTWRETGCGLGITYHALLCNFRIDYILHTKDFEPISVFVPKYEFSDHYPLIAEFKQQK